MDNLDLGLNAMFPPNTTFRQLSPTLALGEGTANKMTFGKPKQSADGSACKIELADVFFSRQPAARIL